MISVVISAVVVGSGSGQWSYWFLAGGETGGWRMASPRGEFSSLGGMDKGCGEGGGRKRVCSLFWSSGENKHQIEKKCKKWPLLPEIYCLLYVGERVLLRACLFPGSDPPGEAQSYLEGLGSIYERAGASGRMM